MNVGSLRHEVTLAQLEAKTGDHSPLSPHRVRAYVNPLPPSMNDRQALHEVTIRYHPQVTLDTVIGYRGRQLFVRGVQNVEERNVEMRLFCEEVIP